MEFNKKKYKADKVLGYGSYGRVYSVLNNDDLVIKYFFNENVSKKSTTDDLNINILREISILKMLSEKSGVGSDNVIKLGFNCSKDF